MSFILTTLNEYLNKNNQIIAYHGGANLSDFDYSKIGSSKHGTTFGNGFYFTSDYEMAYSFAIKSNKNSYIYTCEINPNNPLIISEKELLQKELDFLNIDDNTSEKFYNELKDIYDCIIITNRTFGGNMKFPNKFINFTEYVVYDKNIIKIINKEKV